MTMTRRTVLLLGSVQALAILAMPWTPSVARRVHTGETITASALNDEVLGGRIILNCHVIFDEPLILLGGDRFEGCVFTGNPVFTLPQGEAQTTQVYGCIVDPGAATAEEAIATAAGFIPFRRDPPLCEACLSAMSGDDLEDGVTVSAPCCGRIGLCAECRREGHHDCSRRAPHAQNCLEAAQNA